MTDKDFCLLCDKNGLKRLKLACQNESAQAFWDDNPVSPGHIIVFPKQHISSFFDLTPEVLKYIFTLLVEAKKIVEEHFSPHGYNIGVNEGVVAGRTIPHLHIHLIPRYDGDVPNPRGGIRNIIPGKGNY